MSKEEMRLQDAMEMIRAKLELFGLDRPIGTITLHELKELAAMAIKDVSFLHEPPFLAPDGSVPQGTASYDGPPITITNTRRHIPAWVNSIKGDLVNGQLPFKTVVVRLLFKGDARDSDIEQIIPLALGGVHACEYLDMKIIAKPWLIDGEEAKLMFDKSNPSA